MRIMITGIIGSLGQEFAKQLSKEHEVFGYDNNEWIVAEVGDNVDVRLDDFSKWKFDQEPCDLVIHTAAYKHVDLGEKNPNAFIDNNIVKTRKLFAEAHKNNADILFISTDKAVEPCSLYGYTKAIGEKLAWYYNGYVVRLGNVLSSKGSIIPIWEKCLEENKPLPITDWRMKRYVIEIEEAVKQIWKGYLKKEKLIIPQCSLCTLEEIFKQVMVKKGIENYKGTFEVIGQRAGEKLEEKLRWDNEV